MALNLQSLSISSVFNSIVNFFRSQENNSRWKDLTVGSEGSFLIRLLSNVFSAISYRIVAQSRENYLSTAALRSSNTGIAVNLGYSVPRGSNPKCYVSLYPVEGYTLPKLSVIGAYDSENDIICLEDLDGNDVVLEVNKTDLTTGEVIPNTFKVVIGKVKEETFTAGTEDVKFFSLFTTGISDDYVLYVDGKEVPTTDIIKELKDNKYLVRTNPFDSVDIAYLNTSANSTYKYGVNSEITIRYVELDTERTITNVNLDAGMFSFKIDETKAFSYDVIQGFTPPESVDSIKVSAPLDHEIQNLIRSKADYAGRIRELVPSLSDWNWKALTPTYTQVTYLKDDLTLLTDVELEHVNSVLKENRYFGTPLPDIVIPRREIADLEISLALRNKFMSVSDIDLDIKNIIQNNYNTALGITFSVYDLESKIEELSYVKYARVRYKVGERDPLRSYQLGEIIEVDGKYYKASKILGVSGDSDPNWNYPGYTETDSTEGIEEFDTGRITKDGNITWKAYKRLPSFDKYQINQWTGNTAYGIGDFVYDDSAQSNAPENYMFKCTELTKSSGESLNITTPLSVGDIVLDGGLVWVVTNENIMNEITTEREKIWAPTTSFSLGTVAAYGSYYLECISYRGTLSGTPVPFEGTDYDIESTIIPNSEGEDCYFVLSSTEDKTQYFNEGDYVKAVSANGTKTYKVKRSAYNSDGMVDGFSHTKVYVASKINSADLPFTKLIRTTTGTIDGQILWKEIKSPDEIKYDWNSYVTFDHSINIIGD